MSVKVFYDNFTCEESDSPREIKELMARDASWGTHIPELQAAKQTCGTPAYERWKTAQPEITNLNQEGKDSASYFSLTFPGSNFNFDKESIDHFVGVIAGDILINPKIKSIEVSDFEFLDANLFKSFPGPNVGIHGLYELLEPTLKGIKRPIVAFTVKPRIGLNVDEYKALFAAAAQSGIDIIEDDERLVDPVSCPFEARVEALSELQTKHHSIYSVNITGDTAQALEKLAFCNQRGIRMVKLDVLVTGFECLRRVAREIREKYASGMAITVYPDAYGAYRKLSRTFILRLSRLCGADVIYAGSPLWDRFEKGGLLRDAIGPVHQRHKLLAETYGQAASIKQTLATLSNDQHPSRSELVIASFRKHENSHYQYGLFIGGGISGFPAGMSDAVVELMNCVTHAATTDINNYSNYDFKHDAALRTIGWHPYDVAKALKG